jgi:uncharacterized membrane protein
MRKWLLPASILLNVFLLATLVVQHFTAPPHPPGPGQAMDHLADSLPPADGALLRAAFDADLAALDRSHAEMDRIGTELRAVLARDPFDKGAFRALLVESDQLHAAFGRALTQTFPDVVEKLSAEGRHKMAEGHFPGSPPPKP